MEKEDRETASGVSFPFKLGEESCISQILSVVYLRSYEIYFSDSLNHISMFGFWTEAGMQTNYAQQFGLIEGCSARFYL